MKRWIPVLAVVLVVMAYVYFFFLGQAEPNGSASFNLANTVGLAVVVIGLVAAGFVLRRATPPPMSRWKVLVRSLCIAPGICRDCDDVQVVFGGFWITLSTVAS
jgi:hypothetical protein